MTLVKHIASVAFFTMAALPFSLAEAGPPEIPGNPGVPGLIAEIEALKLLLAATESELAETEDELAACESELAATEDALAAAEDALDATEDELAETEDELAETEDELAETEDELAEESKRYRVPQTGQNQCWGGTSKDPDDPHSTGFCDVTGQDGETQAGLAPPLERFADNGDGTVTDYFTGLVWLKNADCLSHNPPPWEIALDIAKQLPGIPGFPACGVVDGSSQGDWRVPNVNELMSLVQFGANTSFGAGLPDDHPFSGFDGDYYWTSTTFGLDSDFGVSEFVYPCRQKGYTDNRYRFNDAYVVNIATAEVVRLPKESGPEISKRHKTSDGGSCTGVGFTNGSPADGHAFPVPGFIAVRDAGDGA